MRIRWELCGLLVVACESSHNTVDSAGGDESSNSGTNATTAVTTTSTTSGDTPTRTTVGLCDVLERVAGPPRKCVVLLSDGSPGRAHAVDLDGDGRDEIYGSSPRLGRTSFAGGALWRWTGEEIVGGEDLRFGSFMFVRECWVKFDFDHDGTKDLNCLQGGGGDTPAVLRVVDGELASNLPQLQFIDSDILTWGGGAIVDPDEDGVLERMVTVNYPQELRGFRMFREDGEMLVPQGPVLDIGGCSYVDGVAYADFDEDGHEDVAIRDNPIGCNGYPVSYDPIWHRAHVLRAQPKTGDMGLVASLPIGAMQGWEGGEIYADDVTGNRHADVTSTLEPPGLVSFIEGHGDGTFGEPQVFSAADVGLPEDTYPRFLAQLDEDPSLELVVLVPGEESKHVAVLDDLAHSLALLEEYKIPEGTVTGGAGDFDGDGIGDLVVGGRAGAFEVVLLLSSD